MEAGLPPDTGATRKGDLTIEKILEEKKIVGAVTKVFIALPSRKAMNRRIIINPFTLFYASKAESEAS